MSTVFLSYPPPLLPHEHRQIMWPSCRVQSAWIRQHFSLWVTLHCFYNSVFRWGLSVVVFLNSWRVTFVLECNELQRFSGVVSQRKPLFLINFIKVQTEKRRDPEVSQCALQNKVKNKCEHCVSLTSFHKTENMKKSEQLDITLM